MDMIIYTVPRLMHDARTKSGSHTSSAWAAMANGGLGCSARILALRTLPNQLEATENPISRKARLGFVATSNRSVLQFYASTLHTGT